MTDEIAVSSIGGGPASRRSESDFYPTPWEATFALMDFLRLPRCSLIWEPACGEGDMVETIRRCGYCVVGTDIVMGYDFINNPPPKDHGFSVNGAPAQIDFIITNPPFSASEDFIRHALDLNVPFAFLLKSQYWHAARRLNLFEQNPPTFVLPLTWRPDFLFKQHSEKRASPLMDVMWCVWMKDDAPAIYKPLKKPNHLEVWK